MFFLLFYFLMQAPPPEPVQQQPPSRSVSCMISYHTHDCLLTSCVVTFLPQLWWSFLFHTASWVISPVSFYWLAPKLEYIQFEKCKVNQLDVGNYQGRQTQTWLVRKLQDTKPEDNRILQGTKTKTSTSQQVIEITVHQRWRTRKTGEVNFRQFRQSIDNSYLGNMRLGFWCLPDNRSYTENKFIVFVF